VIFGTRENFRTDNMQFEVADFETTYNTFLGRPALTKFMAIPHFTYLVLKMPGPHGSISIKGDVKHVYDCDRESYEMANKLLASAELQELKTALVESHPSPIIPEAKTSKVSIQLEDNLSKTVPLSLDESSKVAHVGNSLDPKEEFTLIKFLQENRDIFAWKPADMPGVPGELIEHELHVDPNAMPIKQHLQLRSLLRNLTRFHHEHLVLILKYENTTWLVMSGIRKHETPLSYVLKCS
jgi:hypothetical protein